MEAAIPFPILQSLLQQLKLPIFGQRSGKQYWRLNAQLQHLWSKLKLIEDVLEEVELMGILFPHVCRKWVCDLQGVLYEANDLLDEARTRSTPADALVKVDKKAHPAVSNLSFFHGTLPNKLKTRINKKLDDIIKVWLNYNLIKVKTRRQQPIITSIISSMTSGGTDGNGGKQMVARKGIMRYDPENGSSHDDMIPMIKRADGSHEEIRRKLLDDTNGICWIIGEPGVGKTTLCRAVYDDAMVKKQFEVRLWVRLDGLDSYIPSLEKIASEVPAKGRTDPQQHNKREDKFPGAVDDDDDKAGLLILKIKNGIGGRRFLLVLDNYPPLPEIAPMEEDPDRWDLIPDHFLVKLRLLTDTRATDDSTTAPTSIAAKKGSKIIITRLHGETFGRRLTYETDNYHRVKSPSLGDGRYLFYQTAFRGLKRPLPQAEWQANLGAKIVSNCGGNPALIRCIGTFLCGKVDDRAAWDEFLPRHRYPSKRYHHCIAELYYSCRKFPYFVCHSHLLSRGGGLINYEVLVSQVEANGLPNISKNVEKWVRNVIFLKQQSQDIRHEGPSYKLTPFLTLHLLDPPPLSQRQVANRFMAIRVLPPAAAPSSSSRNNHQLVDDASLSRSDSMLQRSFISFGDGSAVWMPEPELDPSLSSLRTVRVLDLSSMGIKKLPQSIGQLSQLRYLDLSQNYFRELPGTICQLKKLQTLNLIFCEQLLKLPKGMEKLAHSLKIIRLDKCSHLIRMQPGISELTGLERLDRFIVSGRRKNDGLVCLKMLNNLGGRLSLELPQWWDIDAATDAGSADLKSKIRITELQIMWLSMRQHVTDETRTASSYGGGGISNDPYDVLKRLEPNDALKELSIVNFSGVEFPTWVTEKHLSRINISRCDNCTNLPSFHKMPHLKFLTLTSMVNIEYFRYGHYSKTTAFFPSLKELRIGEMPKLIGWYMNWGSPQDLPTFPKLDLVEIRNCDNLTALPNFTKIRELALQDVHKKTFESIVGKNFEDVRIKPIDNVRIKSIHNLTELPIQFTDLVTKALTIEDCNELRTLKVSDKDSERHGKSLTTLKICRCDENILSSFEGKENDGIPRKNFSNLQKLRIGRFKRLQMLPNILPSVLNLAVVDCPAMKYISDSLKSLTMLVTLKISRCNEEIDCFHDDKNQGMPWKELINLAKLTIDGFKELLYLPSGLTNLSSLANLRIKDCPALVHVSDTLKGLEWLELELSNCEKVDILNDRSVREESWKQLKMLTIKIQSFKNLEALPKGFQHMPYLSKLTVSDCKALKRVPEWTAHNMQRCFDVLRIKSCPYFSEQIKQCKENFSFSKRDNLPLTGESSYDDSKRNNTPFYMIKGLEIYYD